MAMEKKHNRTIYLQTDIFYRENVYSAELYTQYQEGI